MQSGCEVAMAPRKYEMKKRVETVDETRRRIIDATYDLHGEKGVVATSMQDIAERADVSLRTVYNHYPTINDLVAGCGEKVMSVLSPPTAEIFTGIDSLGARVRRLVEESFAMYERGAPMIEVGRCEQSEVAGLAEFVANLAVMHRELVSEALRPFALRSRTVREMAGLTDFYTWKALTEQDLTTRQAIDVINSSLVARASPETLGKRG
jgi:AcrR family transcriptional regulator